MAHARLTAVTNSSINSYKRLCPVMKLRFMWPGGKESLLPGPGPGRGGASTRIERHPDPMCNPYMALAVMLAAGLDGRNKIEPPAAIDKTFTIEQRRKRRAEYTQSARIIGRSPGGIKRDEVIRRPNPIFCQIYSSQGS